MSIKAEVFDPKNGKSANVHTCNGTKGLVVFTDDIKKGSNIVKFLSNDTYGICLNQNIAFSGCPELVHNGGDTAAWTATAITGTWDFASCAQSSGGVASIDATATVNGNEARFTDACCGSVTGGCATALTGKIYITSWSTSGTKDVQFRVQNCGTDIGCTVCLSNYICCQVFCSWLSFAIPNACLGIGNQTFNQLVVETVDIGGGQAPNYYLDCIQFEAAGTPARFTIPLTSDRKYEVRCMKIQLIDALNPSVTNGTVPGLSYNKILNVCQLSTGISIINQSNGIVTFSGSMRNIADLIQLTPIKIEDIISDGTNTLLTLRAHFNRPLLFDPRKNDNLIFIVSENLSGLIQFRVSLVGDEFEF
jgi:hypothetical protein